MDPSSGMRQPGRRGRQRTPKGPPTNPQLFDDTSFQPQHPQQPSYAQPPPQGGSYDSPGGYGGGPPQSGPGYSVPGQQLMNDPMANMAMSYGQNLAGQGREYVQQNLEKYVSSSKLKYYFAVDTTYVGKKLALLVFPYFHSDWSIRYNQDEPVAPRYEINAPDLYIPVMAFVTYVLVAGVVLGTQNRFAPETLGMTSSTALVWLVIEILLLLMAMYIVRVSTDLKYLDLLAYCGYKYVGMILALLGGLMFKSMGYYILLAWMSISLAFFLVRSLKMAIIPHSDPDSFSRGSKRRLYMLLVIALSQPLFMWWLTKHLVA